MAKEKGKSVSSETMAQSHAEDALEAVISNIENWNVKVLNNFLAKSIPLNDDELDIFLKEKINGEDFLRLTKEDLRSFGIKGGPAGRIIMLIESLRPKTCSITLQYEEVVKTFIVTYRSLSDLSLKRFQQIAQKAFELPDTKIIIKYNNTFLDSDETIQFAFKAKEVINLIITLDKKEFYSYKDLKEVLQIYEIDGDEVQDMPQFSPECVYLKGTNGENVIGIDESDDDEIEENKSFITCVEEIKAILLAIGDMQCDQNEAQRSFIITSILVAAINSVPETIMCAKIIENLNYAIKRIHSPSVTEEIVCVTVAKQNDIKEGIAQNIMQISSTFEMNSKKHKLDELSQGYSKHTYGIVTNATEWYFLKYTSDQIYCSHVPCIIPQIDHHDDDLKHGIKIILGKIIWMLKDQERTQSTKKQRGENGTQ